FLNEAAQALHARLVLATKEVVADILADGLERGEVFLQLADGCVALGTRRCKQRATQGSPGRTQFGVGTADLIQVLQLEVVHVGRHAVDAAERSEARGADDGGNESHEYESGR